MARRKQMKRKKQQQRNFALHFRMDLAVSVCMSGCNSTKNTNETRFYSVCTWNCIKKIQVKKNSYGPS